MESSDWLILVADAAKPSALKPVQLQKCLFLLDRKLTPDRKQAQQIYNFAPYDYGPFDAGVYRDAELLQEQGLLAINRAPGQTYRSYQITPAGSHRAQALGQQLDPAVLEYVRTLVGWVQPLSFNQLVSAVYREYPDMKVNSVFRG